MKLFLKSVTFFILVLHPFFGLGQIVSEVAVDSTGKAIPKPIKVTEIIQKVESASANIKATSRKTTMARSIKKIDSLFPEYAAFIKAQKKRKEHFVSANPNRQKINNLIKKWSGYHDHLSGWESVINDREDRNVIVQELTTFNEETWRLTYENAVKEKVPLEVLKSVKQIWDEYKKINRAITRENNEYLVLESKINDQKLIVNEVIDDLNTLKNSEVYNLFYLRHEPLWKSSFKSPEKNQGEKDEVESISENVLGISKFIKSNENSIYIYIISVALLVGLILFLKKIFDKYPFNEEDGDLQNAKDVIFNRTIVSMVFASLVIAKLYFVNTPMLLGNILIFLILIVSIPLVQPYMYKRFKNIIYFVIIFYVLDTAKTYMWFSSAQYRIYLLFEALLVVGVLIAFTRPYMKTRKMKIGNFGLLLIRLTPLVYFLLFVSVVSNILGYTNLTDLTLKVSTQSGVFTLIFYGILMIFGGLVIGIIHWNFSTRQEIDFEKKFALEMKALQVIRVIAFIMWFLFFLKMIDLLDPLQGFFTDIFSDPYQIGNITFTLGDIVQFIFILTVSFLTTSIVSFLFDSGNVSLKLVKLPKGVPAAISLVVRYLIIAFGIVFALSSLGIDLSKFNLMAGALGLGIGFGLQTVISNFVSGLILVFERPIHVGDTVEVNNLLGTVDRIGVRSSSVITFDGAEVVVPNNNLIANDLINWTLSDSIKRVEILIGTKYGSDPNKILEILKEAVKSSEDALKDPEPQALFSDFGDSSLNFRLRFWVHYEVGLKAKSDVSIAIYNLFEKHGIEIPFPQQDVYLKEFPDTKTTISPKKDI
ncbi:mechanosensitive ion channel family protein [Lutimonas zeaxanthinifaciens]|uniref:mechanosensitive ion channel family protein n=1 Tax=Lutimonas zeaxanthinifaciens TaxID=3060215 RepID=UPI00265D0A49|nr:mechanosensitive ion channel domain-containing protein [Lutimonas sp. YSD2104]WKK65657.1 mechanosensitive ion channel [Lutimonas sp. YSD2104]